MPGLRLALSAFFSSRSSSSLNVTRAAGSSTDSSFQQHVFDQVVDDVFVASQCLLNQAAFAQPALRNIQQLQRTASGAWLLGGGHIVAGGRAMPTSRTIELSAP